jgi:multidrug efflux pump subunit AcrA (membrane-fusion protein)
MRFQKLIKPVLLVCLTAVVGASLLNCNRSNGQPSNSAAANSAPTILEVSTVAAVVRQLPRFFEATRTLAADVQTDVQPQTAGKVVAVGVDMGSTVSKGQMLVRLEDADFRPQQIDWRTGSRRPIAVSLADAARGSRFLFFV